MALFDQIKQLEDNIRDNQQLLSQIMYQYNRSEHKDEVIKSQILACKANIDALKQQLTTLETQMKLDGVKAEAMALNKPQPAPISAAAPVAPVQTAGQVTAPKQAAAATASVAPKTAPKPASKPAPKPKEKKNFEAALGKSVMGIIASALVFISFVLFAALLYPTLTATVKLISLFGVSAIFLGIGLWRLYKKANHPLWLSVAGCGIGGLYISLFLSDVYFHVINDIALYALLLIWCVGVCILSRRKSRIFEIIGHIGIVVSVISGAVMCSEADDRAMMLALVIYSIIAMLIFRISHLNREEFGKNWPSVIAAIINTFALTLAMGEEPWAGTYIVAAYVVFELFYDYFFAKLGKHNSTLAISIICNTILFWILLVASILLDVDGAVKIIASIVIVAGTHILIERMKWPKTSPWYYLMIVGNTILYAVIFGIAHDDLEWQLPILGISILYLVWSRFSDRAFYKWLCFGVGCIAIMPYLDCIYNLVVVVLFIVAFYLTEFVKRDKFDEPFAFLTYGLGMVLLMAALIYLCVEYRWDLADSVLLIISTLGAINLAVMLTPVLNNPVTHKRSEGIYILSVIINKILMLAVFIGIPTAESWAYVFVGTILFSATTGQMLKKDSFMLSMWVGIKYTFLIVAILSLADIVGLWVSLIFFVVAIISIILGFLIKRKGLRVYGLILSLISVVKLILIDIDYDNSVMRAASFFICGLLCFLISFIYNWVDKRMKATTLDEAQKISE